MLNGLVQHITVEESNSVQWVNRFVLFSFRVPVNAVTNSGNGENNILKGFCTVFQHALKVLEINWFCFNSKNVENCKKNFQMVKKF